MKIIGTTERDSGKAFLVLFADQYEEWIPKSVITNIDGIYYGSGYQEFEIADWFAYQNGLTQYNDWVPEGWGENIPTHSPGF